MVTFTQPSALTRTLDFILMSEHCHHRLTRAGCTQGLSTSVRWCLGALSVCVGALCLGALNVCVGALLRGCVECVRWGLVTWVRCYEGALSVCAWVLLLECVECVRWSLFAWVRSVLGPCCASALSVCIYRCVHASLIRVRYHINSRPVLWLRLPPIK